MTSTVVSRTRAERNVNIRRNSTSVIEEVAEV
jgi:hypothetical protein